MKTTVLTYGGILAAFATAHASAQTAERIHQIRKNAEVSWTWSSAVPMTSLTVELVRADVRIVRSDIARVEFRATSPDREGDGSPVSLVVTDTGDAVRIVDRYPDSNAVWRDECLPPDGEHGGAWTYTDRLAVTIVVPRRLRISVTNMAGAVVGG